MASTSGSEQEIEEQWDDMAIVRAFEEALTDQSSRSSVPVKAAGRTKQAAPPQRKSKSTAQSVAVDERYEEQKHEPASPAAAARARGTYGQSNAGAHVASSAGTMPSADQQQQQQNDLYQAAYAQAFAQLQAQFQAAYPPAPTPQPFGPSLQMPLHAPYYPPAAPSPSIPMSFPGMPAAPIPGLAAPGAAGPDDGLANVLMSWYQSGYYTGRFQAMQEMKMRSYR